MRHVGIVALILLAYSVGCAQNDSTRVPLPVPAGGVTRFSAEWLKAQPGKQLQNFSFHLLDTNGAPIEDWQGLEIRIAATQETLELELYAQTAPPDDIYLYAVYPGGDYALDCVVLPASRRDEYLLLAVPHRIRDVLVVGLARLDQRKRALGTGTLAQLRFSAGQERCFRQISLVNEDEGSASELDIIAQGSDWVRLAWEERNLGDYNNNSQVEIADVTPVGLYFGQQVASAPAPPELVLVDGDENGEINISDLTPIGRNFQRYIEGYTVYYATSEDPAPGDYVSLGQPTIYRGDVWAAADDAERRQRLQYEYQAAAQIGNNHYYVRAYADDDGVQSEGPASNTVTQVMTPTNLPPVWETTAGLTSAVGSGNGLRVAFGRATDPEGTEVTYMLRYVQGTGPVGVPGTVTLSIPVEAVAGDPPYSYAIAELIRGETYTLNLRAQDEDGFSTSNNEQLQATVPALGSSTDRWPYYRGDPARTGQSSTGTVIEPLVLLHEHDLNLPEPPIATDAVVASAANWVAVFDADGVLHRYRLSDGQVLGVHPAPDSPPNSLAALDGNRFVVGTTAGIAVYDLATTDVPQEYDCSGAVAAAPLLLGDYVFVADQAGEVKTLLVETGEEQWSFSANPLVPYSISPAASAQQLYVLRDDGRLDSFDLLTGEHLNEGQLADSPVGDALALDESSAKLYCATESDLLLEIDGPTLQPTRNLPRVGSSHDPTAPCLLLAHDPPLAVFSVLPIGMLEMQGVVHAVDLQSWDAYWTATLGFLANPLNVTASSDRLLVTMIGGDAYVLDHEGMVRQRVPLGSRGYGEAAIASQWMTVVADGAVQTYGPAATDGPPVWQVHEGISGLTAGDGEITVEWRFAEDDHNLPVFYAICYSAGEPPEFEPPFAHTTIITDIPPGGEGLFSTADPHYYAIDNLDNGTRYYVGVRAYDRPWNENPNIDTNTNWLAVTPPWQREELVLGEGADLPAGEVYFMQGIVDTTGSLHLVYNDTIDVHLTHVWRDETTWYHEGENLTGYSAIGFALASSSDLVIGWATDTNVGVLERVGADSWNQQTLTGGVIPALNPQVSLALGTESALAYTQYISGLNPKPHENYFISQTSTGSWQPVTVLDDQNHSGRELHVVLNPSDHTDPWVAMQRGGEYAPNFPTPEVGTLMYARSDGMGGFAIEQVDAGENAPDSDCGKRVRQVLAGGDKPRLAYFDLNASDTAAVGQLRYAWYDGAEWSLNTVCDLDLSFQTGTLQFTYGELGIALTTENKVLIGMLERKSMSSVIGDPHLVVAQVWVNTLGQGWSCEQLTDEENVFPLDREPCVLLVTPDDEWHLFFVTSSGTIPLIADTIVHLWRPVSS